MHNRITASKFQKIQVKLHLITNEVTFMVKLKKKENEMAHCNQDFMIKSLL